MRLRAEMAGLRDALRTQSSRVLSVVDGEMKDAMEGLKAELRVQTAEALGTRVANAWRGKFYANESDPRGPAAFVWSKAPRILDFFSSSKIITPIGAAFAVPTENVPRGARGRRLSPIEVEARFNAELKPVRLRSGRIGLFISTVRAKSTRRPGLRAATRGRLAQGRPVKMVLMFVLLRQVRSQQLIDLDAIARKWGARTADNIDRKLGLES